VASVRTSLQFPSAEWVLRELPVITYLCENDGLYTMRWICAGGGNPLGYDLQEFVDNRHYFAASAVHPQDLDVVDEFAECAAAAARPALARYRLVTQKGRVLPMLVAARAVRDESSRAAGFCGMVLNLEDWPELQGQARVLSEFPDTRQSAAGHARPEHITPEWIMLHVPATAYVIGNDANHTLRFASGRNSKLSGYEIEEYLPGGRYQPASAVFPDDQDVLDAYSDAAAASPGRNVAARLRLVDAGGELVPILVAARAVVVAGEPQIAGVALDLSHCPALQGPPMLFENE